ncbi:MAG: tetratricopeptide repeat protein [Microcoleaceae cyanobacterium]
MDESSRQLFSEAMALHCVGNLKESEEKYRQFLQVEGHHADAWRELGRVYLAQENYEAALVATEQALALNSTQAISFYYLGLILEKLGDFSPAIQAHQTSVRLSPEDGQSYHQLGNLFLELGDFEQAQVNYQASIQLNPTEPINYLNLGNLLIVQQQIPQAIAIYQTGLEHDSRHPELLTQLGIAFTVYQDFSQAALQFGLAAYYQFQYPEAIESYQEVLANSCGTVDVYLALADCYQQLEQDDQAIELYQLGLEHYPEAIELYLAWILMLQNTGQIQAALDLSELAVQHFSEEISLRFVCQRLLPILYETPLEIEFYRERLSQGLTDLVNMIDLNDPSLKVKALSGIAAGTNFYLQYQARDDLELQKKYGQLVHQVMAANYPKWAQPLPKRPKTSGRKIKRKIKVGYLSEFFSWHTIGLVFLGWVREFNRQEFEVYCYHIGSEIDEITDLFRLYSDYFFHIPNSLEAIGQQIYTDQLDILVFLDIGMCPKATQLAGLQLAPVQCAAWGHPVTTGLPTINYYLSAELLEPKNAQNHYSEQLVCLPNLGIHYWIAEVPKLQKCRSDFGLNEDAIIYLSCQSLFKYLPQYDFIFTEITQQVNSAQIIFIAHWNAAITKQFKNRLQREFKKRSLNSEDYCIILPRLSKFDYLQLNLLADIGLDTIGFTGFLTTLDSIACNLPIVTCRGEFMRGRQSAGILQRIDVTETVAQNETEYCEIAVQLGYNSAWRKAIVEKIQNNKHILYEDNACIQALEKFYLLA